MNVGMGFAPTRSRRKHPSKTTSRFFHTSQKHPHKLLKMKTIHPIGHFYALKFPAGFPQIQEVAKLGESGSRF